MVTTKRTVAVTALVASLSLLVVGCGSGAQRSADSSLAPAKASATSDAPGVQVVVIGDSLARTNWPKQYGEHVAKVLGKHVDVTVLRAMGVADGASLVKYNPTVRGAEILIVQTGFNNVLPDPETGIGCPGTSAGDTASTILRWIRSTEPTCLAEGINTYAGLYDQIFTGLKGARAGKPAVFVAMTSVDGNNDPTRPDGLVGMMPTTVRPEVIRWNLAAYERWNTMLESRATAAGFQVVDLYHAINGPDGSRVVGDLSDDGGHPNAKGDAFYVELLKAVDLSALSRR